MNSICAYNDEYGAFGFKFEAEGTSTHFILSAIIVKKEDVSFVENEVEKLRKQYFQTGEMKSSKLGQRHTTRIKLLSDLKKLPFKVLVLIVDKRKIYDNSGIMYKKTFYKFINQIIYNELRSLYPNLDIMADQVGSNEYMQSFLAYIKQKRTQITLFDQENISCVDSKTNPIVQVADIVSGSLAYVYDEKKKVLADNHDYKKILGEKITLIRFFPRSYQEMVDAEKLNKNINNHTVATICYRKAEEFINKNALNEDIDVKKQVFVLKYLLFRFINNSYRTYISTKELQNALEGFGYEKTSVQVFRARVIAKLRDAGVIIASSPQGLKIPSKVEEVIEFVEHTKSMLLPMLARLKRCCTTINAGSAGDISILDLKGNEDLKGILEYVE